MKKQDNNKSKQTVKKAKTPQDYQQEIGELTAHLQSLQAEFENYKKRQNAERVSVMETAKVSVLNELLPALDNFDRAATHLPEDLENNSWAKGMQYVGQQLLDILEGIGISKFYPLGQQFDHNQCEAIEYVDSEKPEGEVVEVITPGYMISDKVIRPAGVKVSSGSDK